MLSCVKTIEKKKITTTRTSKKKILRIKSANFSISYRVVFFAIVRDIIFI